MVLQGENNESSVQNDEEAWFRRFLTAPPTGATFVREKHCLAAVIANIKSGRGEEEPGARNNQNDPISGTTTSLTPPELGSKGRDIGTSERRTRTQARG